MGVLTPKLEMYLLRIAGVLMPGLIRPYRLSNPYSKHLPGLLIVIPYRLLFVRTLKLQNILCHASVLDAVWHD